MTEADSQPISVLLVEDDPGDVVLIEEAFEHNKVRNSLKIVGDGVEAMAFLRDPANSRPDLVLLDLNLPRKDGREVLAEIKSDPELRSIPVVVLTTSKAEEDILRLAGVGDEELSDGVFEIARRRFVWLAINLGTALAALGHRCW